MTGIGLVLTREALDDRLTVALVQALGDPLADAGVPLVTRVVENAEQELRAYAAWRAPNAIEAVVLLGVDADDQRVRTLRQLAIPFAALAETGHVDGYSAVVYDTADSLDVVRRYLSGTGSRRLIYVAGPEGARMPDARVAAIAKSKGELAIHVVRSGAETVVQDGISALGEEPAVIIVDSDVAAIALTAALTARGTRVPDDAAVLCWTDSVLCQSAQPTITAVNNRASELGALLGDCVLRAATSEDPIVVHAPLPFIVARESA